MEFTKTFNSGFRLIAKQMPSMYTVSVGIFVDVGSVREEAEVNGYSHFIEHLTFKGTERFSAAQISEFADDIGAQLNAFTSKDATCFYTKSSSTDIEKCFDLLSDMYFHSVFDEKEIEREKKVVIEEITMGNDTPEDVSQDLIAEAAYRKQKIGQTIVGSAENIKNSDRRSILRFRGKYYIPANTVLAVAGNFDVDELYRLAEKYFENDFSAAAPVEVEEEEKSVHTDDLLRTAKDTEQAHLAWAYDGFPMTDEDACIRFSLMSNILGGGLSSRLFQSVREQNGLAYSVYSYPSTYKFSGYLEIYCGTNPENIPRVQSLISQELEKFADKGVTETEMKRAKMQTVNGIYMSYESSLSVMNAIGRALLKRDAVLDVEKRVEQIRAVTAEEVRETARKVLSSACAAAYVGPEKYFSSFDKLKSGC